MRKVLSFSAFLVVGLFIAQYLPANELAEQVQEVLQDPYR